MKQRIALVTLVVPDYDDGSGFYRDQLGFDLVEDTPLPDGKRWVVVRPQGGEGTGLLLAEAADEAQSAAIGWQTAAASGSSSIQTTLSVTARPFSPRAYGFSRSRGRRPMARSPSSRTSLAIAGICSSRQADEADRHAPLDRALPPVHKRGQQQQETGPPQA